MVDWSRPLTRVLTLKSGEQLRTLHDAAELFTRRFGSVTKSAPLEHAIGLLLRAAKTGARADRKAATDQVALVLRLNAMVQRSPLRTEPGHKAVGLRNPAEGEVVHVRRRCRCSHAERMPRPGGRR
jgi:hypothetical protein